MVARTASLSILSPGATARCVYRRPAGSARYSRTCWRHGRSRGVKSSFLQRSALQTVLPEALDLSIVAAVGSGFLLALMTAWVLQRERQMDGKKDINADMAQKLEEMQANLKDLKNQLEVDKNRVKVLEAARAAAVKDVTKALGQKRDAEFSLKAAQDEIERLKSGDLREVNSQHQLPNSCFR